MPEFDFSEGFARLDAAFGSGSDQMPFVAQMHEFAMKASGASGREFYTDAKKLVRGILEVSRDYGFDIPVLGWDGYNIEAEALGAKLVLFDDMAPAIDNTVPLIRTEKDLAKLKAPNPSNCGRIPMIMEAISEYRHLTGRISQPAYCAPFSLASHCMTFENLIYQIHDNPKFVHRVMTFLVDEVIAPYMLACFKAFPEASVAEGADAVASLPFITQDMLEEFSLQYIERLQNICDKPVICDNWWGDSFTDDKERFWQLKLRATPLYLKVQDPDLWKIGCADARTFADRKGVPIIFGVDNNLFQQGPPLEIEKRIHEYMEAGEPGGRSVLYFCNLSAVTPPENVRVAIDAVRSFRAGERPWAGSQRAGTPEAVGQADTRNSVPLEVSSKSLPIISAKTTNDPETESRLDEIYDSVMDFNDAACARQVEEALSHGVDIYSLLDDALIAAMDEIGDMFSHGSIFVPEMLMAARAMKAGLEVLRPLLTQTGKPPKGKVMLATVQGDVHDIGKNLVGMMLEGAGYEVLDLGVNVTPEDVVRGAEEHGPDIVGLSALLTTSMPSMQKTVSLFKAHFPACPIIVGGAPVTQEYADQIGADGYGENAPHAVKTVQLLTAEHTQEIRIPFV